MNQKLRVGLMVCLAALFLSSLGIVLYRNVQFRQSAETYREAEEITRQLPEEPVPERVIPEEKAPLAEMPEEPAIWREAPVYDDPHMDEMRAIDLAALREINPDVVGWIRIPGTQLDYPLMQGEDNQFYLEHTWKGEPNAAGSIYLEQYSNADLSDFNTIVYGHRMKNGSMFASLKYYDALSYWEAHPYVYIADDAGAHRYEVFAAYEGSVRGSTYRLAVKDEEKQPFLDEWTDWSVIETGVEPTVRDRILTMSTCTGRGYDTRWVVQARLAAAVD